MPSTSLTLPAPAKLNLFLHITGQRPDGYHVLQTVFQLLDYGDELRFQARADGNLNLHCNTAQMKHSDNLVLRAARLLQQKWLQQQTAGKDTRELPGADIHLSKRLPAGAGLGGGSSDAATTLVGLNHLWQTGFSRQQLTALGLQLGADVPVFVQARSAWAEGIGEELTPVTLPERVYVVLTPRCHIATAMIFSHQQLTRNSTAIKMAAFLAGQSRNDCETLVRRLYPEVDATLEWLAQFAPPRMTGTGASVFAAFSEEAAARAVLQQLPEASEGPLAGLQGFVAKGLNQSVLARY